MELLLAVMVHAANIQDQDGAKLELVKLLDQFPRLQLIWSDAGCAGRLAPWVWTTGGWLPSVVKRNPDSTSRSCPGGGRWSERWSGSVDGDG